jgi:hypothetical protein
MISRIFCSALLLPLTPVRSQLSGACVDQHTRYSHSHFLFISSVIPNREPADLFPSSAEKAANYPIIFVYSVINLEGDSFMVANAG